MGESVFPGTLEIAVAAEAAAFGGAGGHDVGGAIGKPFHVVHILRAAGFADHPAEHHECDLIDFFLRFGHGGVIHDDDAAAVGPVLVLGLGRRLLGRQAEFPRHRCDIGVAVRGQYDPERVPQLSFPGIEGQLPRQFGAFLEIGPAVRRHGPPAGKVDLGRLAHRQDVPGLKIAEILADLHAERLFKSGVAGDDRHVLEIVADRWQAFLFHQEEDHQVGHGIGPAAFLGEFQPGLRIALDDVAGRDAAFEAAQHIEAVQFPFFDAFVADRLADAGGDQIGAALRQPLQGFFAVIFAGPLGKHLVKQMAADERDFVLAGFQGGMGEVHQDHAVTGFVVPDAAESLLGLVGGVFLFHEHPLLDPAETIRVRADIQADILAEFAGQVFLEQQLERADRAADILRGQGVDARFLEDLDRGPGRGGEQHDAAQQQAQQQAPDSK